MLSLISISPIMLTLNIVITLVVYLLVPLIIIVSKKRYEEKKLKRIMTFNGIGGFVLFSFLYAVLGINSTANIAPAVIWSSVGYFILKRTSCTKDKDGFDIKQKNTETTSEEAMKSFADFYAKQVVNTMNLNVLSLDNENDEEFGLVPQKPIYTLATMLVNGEVEYLKRLRTSDGQIVTWKRQGSMNVDNINGLVDIYDIYLISGEHYKTIYINMYGAKKSKKAPKGFSLIEISGNSIDESPWKCDKCHSTNLSSRNECWNCGSKR